MQDSSKGYKVYRLSTSASAQGRTGAGADGDRRTGLWSRHL